MEGPITAQLRAALEAGMDGEALADLMGAIDAVHAGLEREHASMREELARAQGGRDGDGWAPGWVRLPVDADGAPIRAGDVMERDGEAFEVGRIELDDSGEWTLRERLGAGHPHPHLYRHWHAPTVEDVLDEFANRLYEKRAYFDEEHVQRAIAEYAPRLRLAEGRQS